jgi:hypothetical protein
MSNCAQCQAQFGVTDSDRAFLEKVSPVFGNKKYLISDPTLCVNCRQQRRTSFRIERKMYRRTCDFTGNEFISSYSPDKVFKIFHKDIWFSDQWNPMDYGRDFDFNRLFFEQFADLQKEVPRYGLLTHNCENCDYYPWGINSKNVYASSGGRFNEEVYYCQFPTSSDFCFDCTIPAKSRYCYECTDIFDCYECFFSTFLENSSQCWFSHDLIGCHDCFGCVGLRNKSHCLFNEQLSAEQYESEKKRYLDSSQRERVERRVSDLKKSVPQRNMRLINCENCSGDMIKNARNTWLSFDVEDTEDCKYCYDMREVKDSMDMFIAGYGSERAYENLSLVGSQQCSFTTFCWDGNSNLYYCDSCFSSHNLFACIGLRHKQYCIFNKQYSKEEYEELVPKIIEYMKNTQEWGEFFPISLSPFGYNETAAWEFYPMKKQEVTEKGWNWSDYENPAPQVEKIIPAEKLPSDINDIPDDILNWAIVCEQTNKPFKIMPRELKFYRQYQLSIPHIHPDQRHLDRLNKRNPRELWERKCMNCGSEMLSSFAPERMEKVYCEQCYLKEVY